jgi:ABC-type multidrug transport system fused ATPase/permease subunit
MDDFVSAVDHKTETAILKNLYNNMIDQTGLFISHRISALIPCDKIFIMENGRIIDSGTHEELLKANELYSRTFNHQVLEQKIQGEVNGS